ncbi:MAG: hypothetical protein NTV86_19765 [Planctomycetota bacterium]|nr:hypothetical protein [Planctomycetota bacterium]
MNAYRHTIVAGLLAALAGWLSMPGCSTRDADKPAKSASPARPSGVPAAGPVRADLGRAMDDLDAIEDVCRDMAQTTSQDAAAMARLAVEQKTIEGLTAKIRAREKAVVSGEASPRSPATAPAPTTLPPGVTRSGAVLTVSPGANLQEAVASARSGDTVRLTAGLFPVDPRVSLAPADHVVIEGAGASTIVRVADGVGDFSGVFGGQGATLRGFTLRTMTIDLNPARYGGTPSGSNPACAVLAWRFDGVTVDRVDITYGSIVGINLNGPARAARNAVVTGCNLKFVQVGAAGYDNAGVYVECYTADVSHNTFAATTNFSSSAIELHGGPARAVGNTISGYQAGINLVHAANGDPDSPGGDMTVRANVMRDVGYGVLLWSREGDMLRNVAIEGNDIALGKRWRCGWVAGITVNHGGPEVSGMYDRVRVTGNTIRFEPGDTRSLDRGHSGGVNFNTTGIVINSTASGNTVVNLPPGLE